MRQRKAPSINPFATTTGSGSINSGRSEGSKAAAVAASFSGAGLGKNQLKSQYLGRQLGKNVQKAEQQDADSIIKNRARAKRLKSALGGSGVR